MVKIRPGMSIRNARDQDNKSATMGSIGAFARRMDRPDALYVISCSHVLAPYELHPEAGDEIVTEDGAKIGKLVAHTLDRTGDPYVYSVDAAIATVDNPADVDLAIEGVGPITGTGRFCFKGLKVYSKGHNDTALQRGTIFSVQEQGGAIPFGPGSPQSPDGRYTMRAGVCVEVDNGGFGDGGDSGSMVLNRYGCALGLITFRVNKTNRRYFAHIDAVLRDLEQAARFPTDTLRLVTSFAPTDLDRV